MHILERTCLLSCALHCDVTSEKTLLDEIADYSAVILIHARAESVKDPDCSRINVLLFHE